MNVESEATMSGEEIRATREAWLRYEGALSEIRSQYEMEVKTIQKHFEAINARKLREMLMTSRMMYQPMVGGVVIINE